MRMLEIEVRRYAFSNDVVQAIEDEFFVQQLWPVVYILSDGAQKQAYVGETTNTLARFQAHLKHKEKKKLTAVHLVESGKFNKSAALDIEANLIRYMSGDGKYKLLNSNIGIANHNYYQKDELYWSLFERLWNVLIQEGIAEKSLAEISNSDLFKYSPYKALAYDQIASIRRIMEALLDDLHPPFLWKVVLVQVKPSWLPTSLSSCTQIRQSLRIMNSVKITNKSWS